MATAFEFNSTIRTIRPQLVRFVGRLVGDADAEDVVQVVLSKAASALSEFRGDASLRTWLFRIAKNASHDWRRGRKGPPGESSETTSEENIAVGSEDTSQEKQLERRQMSLCVDEVLHRLPESYQVVLALSDLEELSDRETAAILGVTVGTAKIRLHRARAKMKEELEQTCSFYRDAKSTLCCDRKQNFEEKAYPSDRDSRLQVKSRNKGGNVEPMKEESDMSTNETLPLKQKHLIGVGAAIAAGCHPCTVSYVSAAKAQDACDRGARFALERGLAGRERATASSIGFADTTFASPEIDASFRAERALLDVLIGVAAAVAGNASASVEPSMRAAREAGASDEQIRIAIQIARTVRRGAESETEAAVSRALGDEPPPRCCEGDLTADAAQSAETIVVPEFWTRG